MKQSALWLTLLILSCTPAKTSPPVAEVPVPAENSTETPGAPQAPVAQVDPPAVIPPAVVRVFDESLLRGREFLLEAGPRSSAPVRDRYLGPLGAEDSQRQVIGEFLKAAPGSDVSKLTESRWVAYLQSWALRMGAEGLQVSTVRTGVPLPDREGQVMVPVRASGSGTDWTGWVVLSRPTETETGVKWLVSDAQLTRAEPVSGPYDPEAGLQLISSPSRR